MVVTRADVERCFDQDAPKDGRKEDCFSLLYLQGEFGKSAEELSPYVAWGGNDFGLDAFYIDKERRELHLYQFKWSKDQSLFKESFQRLTSTGIEHVFGAVPQDQDQFLLRLRSQLRENASGIDRVLIQFVFNGDPAAAERSAVLDSLREDMESKKSFIDRFFEDRKVDLRFEYRSNETMASAAAAHVRQTFQYTIPFQSTLPFGTSDNQHKMYVGFAKLMDMYGMYKEMGHRFFERNIRSGLSSDRSANRSIRQALGDIVLHKKGSPEEFAFNHNGMTISVEGIQTGASPGEVVLIEPRLLNGAQTIASLDKFLRDHERSPALKRNAERLQSIRILCRIVHSTGPGARDFVTSVTIYNNKQNRVDPWNLHANDLIQLSFQDKFAKDLKIYYERQEKIFGSLTGTELEEMGIEEYKAIELKKLAQTFLAVQGAVDKMSHMGEVFESKKLYESTFRESYLHADSSKILLAYKIQYRLRKMLNEILEKGPTKYGYITNARELIWALLVQGVLNDDDLPQLMERYGKKLRMEKDYSDYLMGLSSRKVRFILGDVVEDAASLSLIANGKYGFLRTKATYERAMDIAGKREKWTKKSL
jgi:AIPR protein